MLRSVMVTGSPSAAAMRIAFNMSVMPKAVSQPLRTRDEGDLGQIGTGTGTGVGTGTRYRGAYRYVRNGALGPDSGLRNAKK